MTAIVSGINTYVVKPVSDIASEAYTGVSDTGLWMGKQVQKLTENQLPRPFAVLLQKLFTAIPVALAYFFLPLPVRLGMWATYSIVSLTTGMHNKVIDQSLGISMTIELASVMTSYLASKQAIDLISAVFSIVAAGFYFHRSRGV
jgi:hypothetical protein